MRCVSNASLAARGKPPIKFEKYLDNKKHFEKSFKVETKHGDEEEKPKDKNQTSGRSTFKVKDLNGYVGDLKTTSGK